MTEEAATQDNTAEDTKNHQQQQEPPVEDQNQPTQQKQEQDEPQVETEEERNWKAFREARKRDRELAKQKEEEARIANEQKQQLQNFIADHLQANGQQGQMTPAQQEQAAIDLLDDEIHTGGEIKNWLEKKFAKQMEERIEQKFAAWRQQEERQTLPQRMKEAMPDYEQVMSQESIDYLEYRAPALAAVLSKHLQDPSKTSLEEVQAAYQAVKCIVPNQSSRAKEDAQTAEIHARPRTGAAGHAARTDAPVQMTAETRKRAFQEMLRASRGFA